MVITFFNYKGMVYKHLDPQCQTITAEYYKQVLSTLITVHIPHKQPEPVSRFGSFLPILRFWLELKWMSTPFLKSTRSTASNAQ